MPRKEFSDNNMTSAAHILAHLRADSYDGVLLDVLAETAQRKCFDNDHDRLLPLKKRRRPTLEETDIRDSYENCVTPPSPPLSPRDSADGGHYKRRTSQCLMDVVALPLQRTVTIKAALQNNITVRPPSPRSIIIKPVAATAPRRRRSVASMRPRRRRPVADRRVDLSLLGPEHRAVLEFYAGGNGAHDFVVATTLDDSADFPWAQNAHRVRVMDNGALVYWVRGERPHPLALAFRPKAVPFLMGFFSPCSRR